MRVWIATFACLLVLSGCGDGSSDESSHSSTPSGVATATRTSAPSPTRTVVPPSTPTATPTVVQSSTPAATPTNTPSAPAACDNLAGTAIGGAEINTTALIAGASGFEYCRVLATIPSKLNFEVRLPTNWNRKALFTGGGLFNGVISPPEGSVLFNPGLSESGYAIIATDSGHQAGLLDASWALNDPEAVENFGFRATHSVLLAARQIIATRYGASPARSYMIGQSGGGREGLIAAQRYPDDFDGIVSLEPVYNPVAAALAFTRIMKQIFDQPGGFLSAADIGTLAAVVRDACDGLDGLEDGIIGNLAACRFDASVLRCDGAAGDGCLTDQQIDTVNTIHSELELDFELANGIRSYPGMPLGGEDGPGGWGLWIFGASAQARSSLLFRVQDQFLKYFVTKDPELDSVQFAPGDYEQELVALSAILDATDADLSAFASRGGKVILWHGLTDHAASALNTIRYYERVVTAAGGRSSADEFIRFYTSPGVDHLNTGAGPGSTEFLAALEAWVEEATPPGDLVSFKLDPQTGDPVLSRPLCRYPNYPRYKGAGDPLAAASFACAGP